jgi:hypothetical protein
MSYGAMPGFVEEIEREVLVERFGEDKIKRVESLANILLCGHVQCDDVLFDQVPESDEGLEFLAAYYEMKFRFLQATGMELLLGYHSEDEGTYDEVSGVFWHIEEADVWEKTEKSMRFEKVHGDVIHRRFYVCHG